VCGQDRSRLDCYLNGQGGRGDAGKRRRPPTVLHAASASAAGAPIVIEVEEEVEVVEAFDVSIVDTAAQEAIWRQIKGIQAPAPLPATEAAAPTKTHPPPTSKRRGTESGAKG
jgi:hypothetical protein